MTGPAFSLQNQLGNQRIVYPVAFGLEPKKGSLVMPVTINFAVQNPAPVNLQAEDLSGLFPFIQGIFVDNTLNPDTITIQFNGTNQKILIPGFSYFQDSVLCPDDNGAFTVSTNGSAQTLPVFLLAFPVAPMLVTIAPGSPVSGQAKIAATNTRVQLPSFALSTGVILTAKGTNAADILIGGSTVTNTEDGTGNGAILAPGASISAAIANTASLFINGTIGDIVSFLGS